MKPQIMILKINKILLTIFFMFFFVFVGYSQDPDEPGGIGTGTPPPPNGLPIDGGISYLVIAGAVFGAYKLRKKK